LPAGKNLALSVNVVHTRRARCASTRFAMPGCAFCSINTLGTRRSHAANTTGTVKVRLVKGLRGTQARHRLSVRALGLNKLNDVRELKDSPQVRGLITQLHYLVRVEE